MTIPTSLLLKANEIADKQLIGRRAKMVHVYGGVGLGKTSLLVALRTILAERGKAPILVSPTCAEMDTADEVLVQIFDGLSQYGLLEGECGMLKDPSLRFEAKVELANHVLSGLSDHVVLLVDEPNEWATRSKVDELFYCRENKFAHFLAKILRRGDFNCSTVIAEKCFEPDPLVRFNYLEAVVVELEPACNVDSPQEITDFAAELEYLLTRYAALREERSFLRLRLLAALRATGNLSDNVEWSNDAALALHFIHSMKSRPQISDAMLQLVSKLAFVRAQISEDLLKYLGFDRLSSELEKRVIRHAYLSGTGDGNYVMPPLLKRVVLKEHMNNPRNTMENHGQLARFHHRRVSRLRSMDWTDRMRPMNRAGRMRSMGNSTLLEEFYGVSHYARMGVTEIDGLSRYFVTQLHLAGRCLLHDLKQYTQAAAVFEQVIKEDGDDDYGHHYKAYNLDYIAQDELASELHYRIAIGLNRTHPRYWSRWINFLITTGRMREARREWSEAGNALASPYNCDEEVFRHLHFRVAQLLVHRAQLDFASQILDEVPQRMRNREAQFIELDQLLKSLMVARDERAVFPAYISPDEYWVPYPHLQQPIHWQGKALTAFFSARVQAWGDQTVELVVGKRDNSEVRYGLVKFNVDEFMQSLVNADSVSQDAIQFVELSFYGDDHQLRVDVYPAVRPNQSTMPKLDPPNSNRYLEGWNPRG